MLVAFLLMLPGLLLGNPAPRYSALLWLLSGAAFAGLAARADRLELWLIAALVVTCAPAFVLRRALPSGRV